MREGKVVHILLLLAVFVFQNNFLFSLEMVTEAQPEFSYGWFSFKPKWLQAMNNCKCFLFIAIVTASIQGLYLSFKALILSSSYDLTDTTLSFM